MCVTRDALAVDTPIWMFGDSAYDILDWHDPCGQQVVVPVSARSLNLQKALGTNPVVLDPDPRNHTKS